MRPPAHGSALGGLPARLRQLRAGGRGLSTLVTGTALGQGLTVLAAPLLTRLYGPADFGALALFTSLASLLSLVGCLRYELAINVCAQEAEAAEALTLSLASALLAAAACMAGVLLLREALAGALAAPGLGPLLWLLPCSLLGMGALQALGYWAARREGYVHVARAKVVQGLSQSVAQLGLGLVGMGTAGLLVGDALSRLGAAGALVRSTWRRDGALLRGVTWRGLLRTARRYRRFPLLGSGAALFNALALEAPVLLLALQHSTRVTGDFALMQRVLALPLALLGQAVGLYYVGEGARQLRRSPAALQGFFRRTTLRLTLFAGLPLALSGLLGPWLVPLVFGPAWREAGRLALALGAMTAVQLVVSPVSQTLNLLERQGLQLAWDAGRLAAVAAALGAALLLELSPFATVVAYAAAMALAYLAMLVLAEGALRAAIARPSSPSTAEVG